ncbi:hypothetical protein GF325_13450 [Candidatus Bathyarchaeota archaeon]|nr:hypothetical protein [Candidatus Bathyarchaeota archaeon]
MHQLQMMRARKSIMRQDTSHPIWKKERTAKRESHGFVERYTKWCVSTAG